MSFKKNFIKRQLRLKLVSNEPGVFKMQIGALPRLDAQYQGFEKEVITLLKLLPGIQDVETEFNTGNVTIRYDATQLTDEQIMSWVNSFIDVAIDNINFISQNWETNLPAVITELTKVLEEKAKLILAN